jgi:anti-sigma regulatory factor (Ser/Thr protein kinase)
MSDKAVAQIRHVFSDLGLPPRLLDDANLLVSELVTNSIRHSGLRPGDLIGVDVTWSPTKVRVDVRDRPEAAPHRSTGFIRPRPGADSGWGLYLVDRLASRWGKGRGRYWFELEVEQSAADRGA